MTVKSSTPNMFRVISKLFGKSATYVTELEVSPKLKKAMVLLLLVTLYLIHVTGVGAVELWTQATSRWNNK